MERARAGDDEGRPVDPRADASPASAADVRAPVAGDEGRRRRPGARVRLRVRRVEGGRAVDGEDVVVTEEPLEIRVALDGAVRPLAVTMRTPGSDFELVAGFLFTEGVVAAAEEIRRMRYCVDRGSEPQDYNAVTVDLAPAARPAVAARLATRERHFVTTSACGVCGAATFDPWRRAAPAPVGPGPRVSPDVLHALPERLLEAQGVFRATGGLHAAALFDEAGELVAVREDVGRHNALDKLIGWALLSGRLPLHPGIVVVSGRASYELVHKAAAAGAPIVCAVSAPSSLAVRTARAHGVTLVGFLRAGRFNVYAGAERITV